MTTWRSWNWNCPTSFSLSFADDKLKFVGHLYWQFNSSLAAGGLLCQIHFAIKFIFREFITNAYD
jgi:hypothetical protein